MASSRKRRARRARHEAISRRKYLSVVTVLLFVLFVINGLAPDSSHSIRSISDRGYLRVITRNAPTTYYEGRDGPAGMEYDLATAFADYLGVKTKFIVKDSVNDVMTALHTGEGDLAAAGLIYTPSRAGSFLMGPPYQEVKQQVVCLRGKKRPKSVKSLARFQIMVTANSNQEEVLTRLKRDHPDLQWKVTYELDAEDLLEMVADGKIDCTVVDSNIVAINRRYFPELLVAFNISKPGSLNWVLPHEADELHTLLQSWLNAARKKGELELLAQKYYGHIDFNYADTSTFMKRITKDLPRYKPLFKEAEQRYGISWTLLAAQAYQESHWKVGAVSPTGVRGIMMLTRVTARELGVKNRMDPKQSITGGARYLAQLYKRLPSQIKEPDRMWIALAAYNVGLGHIFDVQSLAKKRGKNPNSWKDLSELLPLLSNKKYYVRLKHGYARGREPVRYVNNIRDYVDILEKQVNYRRTGS